MYPEIENYSGLKPLGSIFKQNKERIMKSIYKYDQKFKSIIIPNKSFK
jgi:hypothetical protein